MTTLTHEPTPLTDLPPVTAWLSDMDGVLVKKNRALPGANELLAALRGKNIPFLILTNNSVFMNRDPFACLANSDLDVPEGNIWTSANAAVAFLHQQSPGSTAYVIGEAGLTTAIHSAEYAMTEIDSEFVMLGEVRPYDFHTLTHATRLIEGGAKFIATNSDVSGPFDEGTLLTCGATVAMITVAIGQKPYFVGKPNPVMIRAGLNKIGAHSESAVMVGDRMDTDARAGVGAGLCIHLVLSGSMAREDTNNFPFRPSGIHEDIGDLIELVEAAH